MNCFKYCDSSFSFLVSWNNHCPSKFDDLLLSSWTKKQNDGVFRYKLVVSNEKILDGKFKMFAQLNIDRATNRRDPQHFKSILQMPMKDAFNFLKIKPEEFIMKLVPNGIEDSDDFLAVNVSPHEKGHCLLLPQLHDILPQLPTAKSLTCALHLLLLSNDPAFRVCFNSLCAYASVNHLHFHTYYLNTPMILETIKCELVSGPCYSVLDYPGKAFVFFVESPSTIDDTIRNVLKLINYFKEKLLPHNIVITRGSSSDGNAVLNCVRIYVWARKPAYDKPLDAFNPAVCELFGHLVIKNEEAYREITEEYVAAVLDDITGEIFENILPDVKELFQ